ncbi:hypothetical protein HPB47_015524 [Ixodes persulcatus]|uniref:Uncharacterized protein n=2 Tax=Ixodes persulcatus TaxID=34615 RepID=A0AC60QUJ3_IXOPE|nr:hypothetical protein HPB47_015524 [Ixodes persulcatus]
MSTTSDVLPPDAPAPRLCHLVKIASFEGYGFNLHAEKSKPGQFIGKVDPHSPAELAGMLEGDRIVEVNGVNIANENHKQVVERIKSVPDETKLLVVDSAADAWYKDRKIVPRGTQDNVLYIRTPADGVPQPNGHHHEETTAANGDVVIRKVKDRRWNDWAMEETRFSSVSLADHVRLYVPTASVRRKIPDKTFGDDTARALCLPSCFGSVCALEEHDDAEEWSKL